MLTVMVLIAGAMLLQGCADNSSTARSDQHPVHGVYIGGGGGY